MSNRSDERMARVRKLLGRLNEVAWDPDDEVIQPYTWWRLSSCVLLRKDHIRSLDTQRYGAATVARWDRDRHWEDVRAWYDRQKAKRKEHVRFHRAIPAAVRRRVMASGECAYCGDPAEVIDHVRPVSRGGTRMEYNLAPACDRCNMQKLDMTVGEWKSWRLENGLAWPPLPGRGDYLTLAARYHEEVTA